MNTLKDNQKRDTLEGLMFLEGKFQDDKARMIVDKILDPIIKEIGLKTCMATAWKILF